MKAKNCLKIKHHLPKLCSNAAEVFGNAEWWVTDPDLGVGKYVIQKSLDSNVTFKNKRLSLQGPSAKLGNPFATVL